MSISQKKIDPIVQEYETFEKIAYDTKKRGPLNNVKNLRYFGSGQRFKDGSKSKSVADFLTPGSGQYNMLSLWRVFIIV